MGKLNEARTGYKGDGWKTWHSSARLKPEEADRETRQERRGNERGQTWFLMSGDHALTDSHGIIPRKVRRDMWQQAVKRARKVK